MNNTKIEWCSSSWNPVTGCYHSCKYCYARKITHRYGGCDSSSVFSTYGSPGQIIVGDLDVKSIHGDADHPKLFEIHKPVSVSTKDGNSRIAPYPFYFNPTIHHYRLDEPQHKTKPQTIFVCSMSDLFGKWVPESWIEKVLDACSKAPQHKYLFLTKNPERYIEIYNSKLSPYLHKDNMWFGTSVTTISQLDRAVKSLGNLPEITNTFFSIEPLLEDVTKSEYWDVGYKHKVVDWVIIGAETGISKNKIIPEKEWIDNICKAANSINAPVFMKDSLVPIVGEVNMRQEFPFKGVKL